jgi:hypothetical protein
MDLIVVLLPEPDAPNRMVIPDGASKSTSSMNPPAALRESLTRLPPNCFLILTEIIASHFAL